MKNILITFFLVFTNLAAFSQDKLSGELKTLIDNKEFDKIISQYTLKTEGYSAKSLYYVGLAYYMKEDDENCIKFMDLSIKKDAYDPEPYFIKASTLTFIKRYEEAVKDFQLAIKLKPNDCEYYTGLGDAYYSSGKSDSALEAYKKASEQVPQCERSFVMLAQVYAEQKKNDKALEALYALKSGLNKDSLSYANVLFNIGQLELLNKNYPKAEIAFIEMIQIVPDDYQSYAKLVQVYYGTKQYASAKQYIEELYAASKKGLLQGALKDKFCFDLFEWKGRQVLAYERFQSDSKDTYNKHIFYVMNANDNIECSVQTEYSPISVELGGTKYLLCMSKDNKHYTYNVGFNDNPEYDDLKKSVIAALDGKLKAVAGSK